MTTQIVFQQPARLASPSSTRDNNLLSYRHSYHAGNFADVLKHVCLIDILDYLTRKDKPLCYIDTHAGRGAYSLSSTAAHNNLEYTNGIGHLWQAENLPPPVQRYVDLVRAFNATEKLNAYPGSPWFAQQLLRAADRLFLCELHNSEAPQLRDNFRQDKRVQVRQEDGLAFALSVLPPRERRGLVLIDPAYEVKAEYKKVADTLMHAHKRFATGCYALWYPVVERPRIAMLEETLQRSGIRNILLLELGIAADSRPGMTASGMIIINPPWQLAKNMQSVLPFLAHLLGNENGHFRLEWLVEE